LLRARQRDVRAASDVVGSGLLRQRLGHGSKPPPARACGEDHIHDARRIPRSARAPRARGAGGGPLRRVLLRDEAAATTQPHAELVELLCTIPGVNVNTARVLIAECGLDMSVFGSAEHLVSWAGICPGLNQSGGRRRSGKTRHGNRWLRKALTEAARAAARSKNTYLASHYWQIRGRRGDAKAIGATRHDILIAYYHIVRERVPFRELGADWLARRHSVEHRTHRLVRQLEALGHTVTLEAAA
jgi:transposase